MLLDVDVFDELRVESALVTSYLDEDLVGDAAALGTDGKTVNEFATVLTLRSLGIVLAWFKVCLEVNLASSVLYRI